MFQFYHVLPLPHVTPWCSMMWRCSSAPGGGAVARGQEVDQLVDGRGLAVASHAGNAKAMDPETEIRMTHLFSSAANNANNGSPWLRLSYFISFTFIHFSSRWLVNMIMPKNWAYIAIYRNLQHVQLYNDTSRHLTIAQAECGDLDILDAEVAVPNPRRSLTFGASASGVATWTFALRNDEERNESPICRMELHIEFHMARIASNSFQFIEFIEFIGLIFLAFGQDVGTDLGCHGSIFIFFDQSVIDRRKFRSETSDNMDSWKAEVRRVRREKIRRKKMRRERVRRKKMQMREKVGKSRFTVFFQWFVAPEGRKVGSLKRRVRRQLARWEMKKCTPLWREAHFQVKMYKTPHGRTTFGSWDVEKVHAVVARSTFPSENAQSTTWSDHFWKLRCRKSARRCGAKHMSKWKCTKHHMVGPLLEVEMSKKCTPLWREAHFQVKMYKTHQCRTTFGSWDVEKVHAVVARSTFRSQKC